MSKPTIERSSGKYKLIYFNGRARGETIRLLLVAGGINYEDKRIGYEEWPAMKPNTPWGGIPLLEVDGKTIGQSMAIARYVAREAGLAGKSSLEQALVDSVVDTVTEIRESFIQIMLTTDESAKEKLKQKFNGETLVTTLKNLDKFLGGRSYFVGDKMSFADVHFFAVFDIVSIINPGALKGYPKLNEVYQKVASNAKIAEYLKKRPDTPF